MMNIFVKLLRALRVFWRMTRFENRAWFCLNPRGLILFSDWVVVTRASVGSFQIRPVRDQWEYPRQNGTTTGCLPFTRRNRLVDSCNKWNASNPK